MVQPNDTPLPPGWKKEYSSSQKRDKFICAATKHYQWHFPTQSKVDDPQLAKARADKNAKAAAEKGNAKVDATKQRAQEKKRHDERMAEAKAKLQVANAELEAAEAKRKELERETKEKDVEDEKKKLQRPNRKKWRVRGRKKLARRAQYPLHEFHDVTRVARD